MDRPNQLSQTLPVRKVSIIYFVKLIAIWASNMLYYALTSAGPPRVVLKPEPERLGF